MHVTCKNEKLASTCFGHSMPTNLIVFQNSSPNVDKIIVANKCDCTDVKRDPWVSSMWSHVIQGQKSHDNYSLQIDNVLPLISRPG